MEDTGLVSPKEGTYFGICLAFSILIYLVLFISIVGILYILLFAFVGFMVQGLLLGHIKGNAVKVSPTQFPKLHQMVEKISAGMGLAQPPPVYVQQSGGVLNAFASRFLARDFVVVYSDILELALEKGEDALAFVVAHELGHVARKHMAKRLWIYPGLFVPFLGTAYYRACEYTADRYGARYAKAGAIEGLLVLAAGKHLYRDMDADEFSRQAGEGSGFFYWFAEKMATHPHLNKRVKALETFTQTAA
jgi:Zn-dependent protease with chaperone function